MELTELNRDFSTVSALSGCESARAMCSASAANVLRVAGMPDRAGSGRMGVFAIMAALSLTPISMRRWVMQKSCRHVAGPA